MDLIDTIVKQINDLLLLIGAVVFSYSALKTHKSKAVKYLALYLVLSFCFTVLSILIVDIQGYFGLEKNNLFISHYFLISQYVVLSLFYSQFFNRKQRRYQVIISVIVFLILIIQYSTNPSIYYRFNLLEILLTSFPLVVYSIIHLYNSLSKPGSYMFINAGVLVYLSICSLIFILGNLMNTLDRSLTSNIWFLNRVFYTGYLLVFLIEWKKSLWKTKN